jgi:hypothetical protein
LAAPDFSAFQNLELKKLEDKPMHADTVKSAPLRTNQMSIAGPSPKMASRRSKEDCDIITICKKSRRKHSTKPTQVGHQQESQLSFLKNQKLIP